MARTVIPLTTVTPQLSVILPATNADAMNGMMFLNDGSSILQVTNGSMSDKTVTVISVPDEAGRTGNLAQVMAAGTTYIFGPFRQAWWNQTTGDVGYVYVNFSDATSVTCRVINF